MLNRMYFRCVGAVAMLSLAVIAGCSTSSTKPATLASGAAHGQEVDGPLPGLAELSAADRAAAQSQRVCPVSGQLLGSMGKPPKITVEGNDVFLCCAGCEGQVRNDPSKYLAKVKAE